MILLTGGTGFVGRHLARGLIADGQEVRVLSRTPRRATLPDAVSWARGDLNDPESLRSALVGVDTVVHAGALLGDGSAPDPALERVNVGGTDAIARAARDVGIRRFVHVSSAGVYGNGDAELPHRETDPPAPSTPYERSKLSAEQSLAAALEGSPVRWTILRPQGLYGPDRPATDAFFRLIANKRLWLHGPANVIVHPTHIDDLAAAVRLVVGRRDLHGEVINIGGERWLEYRELILLIGARMGHAPVQISAPRWTAQACALVAVCWNAFATVPPRLEGLSRVRINRAVDIEKARRLIGFRPVTLERGLDRTAEELRRRR